MTSTFTGFSEEDLQRIKTDESKPSNEIAAHDNPKKNYKLGARSKKLLSDYKLPQLQNLSLEDPVDEIDFEKCKLSLKPTCTDIVNNNEYDVDLENVDCQNTSRKNSAVEDVGNLCVLNIRKTSIVNSDATILNNYTENELALHKAKLEELQLRQKIMEEQNKKRKEMLAKALADRTKQTAEEAIKLEKIKKELQVLDGQLSQDVSVLRKKIDQACLSYAEAEKHYLKVEKEFLQAKLNLQKQKEQKELLTEHLCALITHNETRKAKKLETLMLQLSCDGILEDEESTTETPPIIVDGVDERTGKIVEVNLID